MICVSGSCILLEISEDPTDLTDLAPVPAALENRDCGHGLHRSFRLGRKILLSLLRDCMARRRDDACVGFGCG